MKLSCFQVLAIVLHIVILSLRDTQRQTERSISKDFHLSLSKMTDSISCREEMIIGYKAMDTEYFVNDSIVLTKFHVVYEEGPGGV